MSTPRTYQTEAIIIKKTKLGEADRILTLYTPHLGKIQAVAKGVRRPKSKMAGHLELLTHSLVSLAHGRNLDTITGSQTINSFLPLKSDLKSGACALYATELVNHFAADSIKNSPLFHLLLNTLHRLCQAADGEVALRYFELHLLDHVGYRPQLHRCVSCSQPLKPAVNSFCSSSGGILCAGCSRGRYPTYPLSIAAQEVLRLLQDNDYDAASRLDIGPALAGELEQAMRQYIRYFSEREIKSARWLDALRKQTEQATLRQR
ncbi:MAG: DNA repair protein RecO [Chloroflexi bacterium]|nr:DNA repair protein RecO [Chloroflexota bacterium]